MSAKKIDLKTFGVLFVGLVSACFAQESLILPLEEDRFPLEETFLPDNSPITPDELATPPVGEFKKVFLRDLVAAKNHVMALLTHLQSKGESVNPLAIEQANALIHGIDKAIASRSVQDALAIDELYDSAWLLWRWDSIHAPFGYFDKFGFLLFDCFERTCQENSGVLTAGVARKFTRIFYSTSKIPWESEGVDGHRSFGKDSLWLCNPLGVSEALKELALNGVGQLGCADGLTWLGAPDSLTLPVLRARYQSDPGPFDTALAEYRNWALIALDAPPSAGEISKREVISLKCESARLGRLIELLEHGTVGKNHPLFPKLKVYKAALDQLAASAKISDIKEVILASFPFEQEWLKVLHARSGNGTVEEKDEAVAALGLPEFFFDVSNQDVDPSLRWRSEDALWSMYADSVSGSLPPELFESVYLWIVQDRTEPNKVAADVFVLFPDQTTERLKSLPLAERKRVLEYKGNLLDTSVKFFEVFTTEAEEHPNYVLNRYQTYKAEIDTKFTALIQWHKSQPTGQ